MLGAVLGCAGSGRPGRVIEIRAGERFGAAMYYDPARIDVVTDELVTFVIINEGGEPHSFGSVEAGIPSADVQPGRTVDVTWEAPSRPCSFQITCDYPEHAEAGMQGVLVVSAANP